MKKRPYHHGDLARALLGAALEIIAEEGPEAFTLRQAAAGVGVTHGAAYRHFADKEALLATLEEEGYRALGLRPAAAANTTTSDPRDRVRALAAAYVEFASYFHKLLVPFLDGMSASPAATATTSAGRAKAPKKARASSRRSAPAV